MEIIKDIAVDLYQTLPLTILAAKQGDTGRGFRATITAGDEIPDFSSATIAVYIKKPDGTKIYNACTADGNVITGELTNQALAIPGEAEVELQAQAGNDILSTPIFTLLVLPSNIDDSAIESQDEFSALETALGTLSTYNSINEFPLGNRLANCTDLAAAHAAQGNNRFAAFRYLNTTTDKPSGATNGGVISYKYASSSDYGAQLAMSATGAYLRTIYNNVWSTWTKIDPTYMALTSGQSSVTVNGAAYSQIGQAVTVHVWFTPTEAISGALTGVFSSAPRPLSKVVVPIYPNSSGSGVASAGYAYIVRGANDIRFSGTNLTSGTGYCFTMSYLTY